MSSYLPIPASLRIAIFLLLSGIVLSACAHTLPSSASMPAKEAAMNTTSPDAAGNYRPHTLDEFPELTPEEVGRRFLKLIDSLKSFDDLSHERLREVMRLPLTPSPETHGESFWLRLPESDWHYYLRYSDNPQSSHLKSVSYEFLNWKDDRADMAPVCGMDFNAYVTELKSMGFVEREDLAQYDSPMPPINADGTMEERQFFRIPTYFFSRGNIGVLIHERREADAPDVKLHHACVESISVGGGT